MRTNWHASLKDLIYGDMGLINDASIDLKEPNKLSAM